MGLSLRLSEISVFVHDVKSAAHVEKMTAMMSDFFMIDFVI